jgi:hypothetical protein
MSAVYGNASFTKVEDLAGRLANITASDGVINTLTANSITTQHLTQNMAGDGTALKMYQVTGYAPVGFSTLAINAVQFLNSAPTKAAATAVGGQFLLLLPTGAQIVQADVTNNGTTVVGATTFDIGTEVWTAAPTGTDDIFTAATLAGVNAGATVGQTADLGFATSGKVLVPLGATAANTGISVQALAAANTAGDLAIRITYLV